MDSNTIDFNRVPTAIFQEISERFAADHPFEGDEFFKQKLQQLKFELFMKNQVIRQREAKIMELENRLDGSDLSTLYRNRLNKYALEIEAAQAELASYVRVLVDVKKGRATAENDALSNMQTNDAVEEQKKEFNASRLKFKSRFSQLRYVDEMPPKGMSSLRFKPSLDIIKENEESTFGESADAAFEGCKEDLSLFPMIEVKQPELQSPMDRCEKVPEIETRIESKVKPPKQVKFECMKSKVDAGQPKTTKLNQIKGGDSKRGEVEKPKGLKWKKMTLTRNISKFLSMARQKHLNFLKSPSRRHREECERAMHELHLKTMAYNVYGQQGDGIMQP